MIKLKYFASIFLVLTIILSTACSPGFQLPFKNGLSLFTPIGTSNSSNMAPAKYLVLISIDACRPDYFNISDVPNIKKLIEEGTSYTNAWTGQLRNDTPPGHTLISTGSFARDNGILGFTWKDPVTQKQIRPTDWDPVVSGEMTRLIKESGCTSIGSLYKTKYPDLKVAAISSDKFYAATGLGAESADYILFNAAQHMKEYATKGGINLAPGGVSGHLAPGDIMSDPALKSKKINDYDGDTWATDLAIKLFNEVKPGILLINLPQTDHSGHSTGGINNPKEMGAVVSNVDKQIGRLVDTYKQAGIYDQTIFVVTSDHAMTPQLSDEAATNIRRPLTAAGIQISSGGKEIFLENPARAEQAANIIAGLNIPDTNGIYFKKKAADGSYSYYPSSATAAGISADLNKCNLYLLSTFASEKSCDVYITSKDVDWKSSPSIKGGNHGAATWTNQHVPMILSGPGIKKGFISDSPARLVDLAPTVLTAMGINPQKMDGIVLADALTNPSQLLVTAQQKVNAELVPIQKAFKSKSEQETGKSFEKASVIRN
jgi:predicted AlkP superfamily pyrophosphatase or phosphodiesterase